MDTKYIINKLEEVIQLLSMKNFERNCQGMESYVANDISSHIVAEGILKQLIEQLKEVDT
jgi:hypothetical protein